VVSIDITYEGDLHTEARHGPSGARLSTDAPVDNHGRGQSFSPTDLVATGLGTCMATVMGILANRRGYALAGMRVNVKKFMTPPPRRIARLEVEIHVPDAAAASVDAAGRADLEYEAHHCPVRLSLLEGIEVPVTFAWGSAQPQAAQNS
jgi:putative redox protein